MTNKYFLFPAIALALASCSQTDEPGTLSEPKAASFSAQIGEAASRAAGTQWGAGDAIGISGVSGSKTYSNVKFVTDSGDGNFSAESDNIYYQTTDPVTFSAYYPYTANLADDGRIYASTADQTKQPSFDFLWAQATGNYSAPAVNFNFTHKMSKINIAFTNGNDVDLSDLTFSIEGLVLDGTFDAATGEAKAAENGSAASLTAVLSADSKASMIVFPQGADNLTVKATADGQQYSCTLSPGALAAGNAYTFTISVKKTGMTVAGSTITDWNHGGDFNGNATMPEPVAAKIGDYYYSDGTYSSTLDANKSCIGIVFWTPADANPSIDIPASLTDDKIMNADFPDCTHGLVVALNEAGESMWQEYGEDMSVYDNFQDTGNFQAENKDDYRPIQTDADNEYAGPINYILGYQNTKLLRTFNQWCASSGRERSKAKVLDLIDSYSASNPAPANTTGWFIPSAKELTLLIQGDKRVLYASSNETMEYFNTLLEKAGGARFTDDIWSSSEYKLVHYDPEHPEANATIYHTYDLLISVDQKTGLISNRMKYSTSFVRPILAF